MNISELEKQKQRYEKFFVDTKGVIYHTDDLHEKLAREICEKNGLNWRNSGKFSAEDFLLDQGYIKFSNYSNLRYVAASKKYIRDRDVMNTVYKLADMFNLKVELY